MLKTPYETIYGHKKKVWNEIFQLGSTVWNNNVSICTSNSRNQTKASNVQYLLYSYSPSSGCDVRHSRIVGLHTVGERESLGLTVLLPAVPLLFGTWS